MGSKVQALKAKKQGMSAAQEQEKIRAMLDEDYVHEEDPMGQTVVQGQQSEEWKAAHPFEAAQLESQMDRGTKDAIKVMAERKRKANQKDQKTAGQ